MERKTLKQIRKEIREVEEAISSVRHSELSKSEKKRIQDELGTIAKKLRRQEMKERREVRIYFDGVHYGQIPTALLRDSSVSLQAKGIYGVLHSYAKYKELEGIPESWPSQETLAEMTGVCKRYVRQLAKELANAGWITIEQRGLNMSNGYRLLPKKRRIKRKN